MARFKYCPDCGTRMDMSAERRMFCGVCRTAWGKASHARRQASTAYQDTRQLVNDPRWRNQFRPMILRRDQFSCQNHARIGVVKVGKSFPVDHIVPRHIAPDMVWTASNCETLCPECHNRKTCLEQRGLAITWRPGSGIVICGGTESARRRLAASHRGSVTVADNVESCFELARQTNARPIVLPGGTI